jgi:hypothetical protein
VLAPVPDAGPTLSPQFAFSPIPVQASDPHGRHLAFTWKQVAIGIYAAVALVLLVQLALGYRFARRLVRNSKPLDWPRVRESESISVPMTVGQISPTILLPIGWREWDAEKLHAVLAHEEAHVRRADWAIGVMSRINCCVFWFHPLAWWLKRELALLAEYACDDSVLAQMGDRREYARALLEIAFAMKSAHGRLLGDAVPMAKETNVEKRMEQILDDKRKIPPAFGWRGWVTLLVCSLPVGYFASAVQFAPAQTRTVAPAQEPSKVSSPNPEAKEKPVRLIAQNQTRHRSTTSPQVAPAPALPSDVAATPIRNGDEEVTWIISDDDVGRSSVPDGRRASAFIAVLAAARSTPGTEENEMKEELSSHRLGNKILTGIPGWQTDRTIIKTTRRPLTRTARRRRPTRMKLAYRHQG